MLAVAAPDTARKESVIDVVIVEIDESIAGSVGALLHAGGSRLSTNAMALG